MKKNNFIVSEKLQDDIVWLCVTDTEFLELTKGKLDTDWLPSVPAKDVLWICSEYFRQHGRAPNDQFPHELGDFLQDKPGDIQHEYYDYMDNVLAKNKPLRSNVLSRIKSLIDVYSVQQVKKTNAFVERDNGDRLLSVNAGDIQSQDIMWFWLNRFPLGACPSNSFEKHSSDYL